MKKLSTGSLCTAYILLATSFALSFHLLTHAQGEVFIISIIEIIAIICGFMYFWKGYKKDAAKYFRAMMFLIASTYVIDYIVLAITGSANSATANYFEVVIVLIIYGNYLLLAVAKDLGEKTTKTLIVINILAYIVALIATITIYGSDISTILQSIEWIVSAVIVYFMAKAKYIDKSNRNTK